jgi:arylsulfatase A
MSVVALGALVSSCAGLRGRGPATEAPGSVSGSRPNVVLIYTDDLGYSDVGFQSQMPTPTPAIQALAETGLYFRNFYSASSICSPARASLLSGKFPPDTGVGKALFPGQGHGVLRAEETTLGELFLGAGYQTGFFGKWHVGDLAGTRPLDQGFQRFTGILHSHDLTRTLFRQDQVADGRASTEKILQSILSDAVSFISERREAPFFIMYSTPMPHVPLPKGYSYQRTLFQIDQDVARIVEALEKAGVRENTLIIFASDNGPWVPKGDSTGESWPHRGTKGSTLEGGFKVPMVASWPARHRELKVVEDIVSGTDFFSTFAEMLGIPSVASKLAESRSFWARLSGDPASAQARSHMPFYSGSRLEALRAGRWKYDYDSSRLYDLERDPAEARDVSGNHPEVVRQFATRDVQSIGQRLGTTVPSSSRTVDLLRPEDAAQSTFYQQSIPQHGIYFSPVGTHNLARVEALAYEGSPDVVSKFLSAGLDVNRVFERFGQAVGATGASGEFSANLAALWSLSGQVEKLRLGRERGVAYDLRVKTRPFKHSRKARLAEHLQDEIEAWTEYERLSDVRHRDYFSRHLVRLREAEALVRLK